MTSLTGSPSRSNNSFLNRYVESLGSDAIPQLKPLSPSKLNSNSSPSSAKVKALFNPDGASGKENAFEQSPTKLASKRISANLANNPFLAQPGSTTPNPVSKSCLNSSNSSGSTRFPKPESPVKLPIPKTFDTSTLSKGDLQYYEFLCRVGEAKKWIENIIGEQLPSEVQLVTGDSMRNGVYLAQLAQKINPNLVGTVYPAGTSLQFKHTQNINAFFSLVDNVGVPDLFKFELTDLYEKKDIPKVFETLHALASIINKKWPSKIPEIENLSGVLSFSVGDIKMCQKKLPHIRNFRPFKNEVSSPLPSPSRKQPEVLIEDFSKTEEQPEPTTPAPETPDRHVNDYEVKLPEKIDTRHSSSIIHDLDEPQSNNFSSLYPSISNRTPYLAYSPTKTFSYYSPTISRHLSYRNDEFDIYTKRRYERDYDEDYYDVFKYNIPSYSPTRRQRMTEAEFLDAVMNLQANCRAVNIRYSIFLRNKKLELVTPRIVRIQAQLRATKIRKTLSEKIHGEAITGIQLPVRQLQALIRGTIKRENFDKLRLKCIKNERTITRLQAFLFGVCVRRRCESAMCDIKISYKPATEMQAVIRGTHVRRSFRELGSNVSKQSENIVIFQSFCRGFKARRFHRAYALGYQKYGIDTLICFQALTKGSLLRHNVDSIKQGLLSEMGATAKLIGHLQGYSLRKSVRSLQQHVEKRGQPITLLQAKIKGILTRYALELVCDIVEVNSLDKFQGIVSGMMVRREIKQMNFHYARNVRSVIVIQSWIRSYHQKKAYEELMNSGNPSLWSVRKFAHLLNGIQQPHESRNKLEDLKEAIDQTNLKNDGLEKKIRALLTKAELLERKQLSVEDYLKDRNLFADDVVPSTVENLSKNAKSQISLYEKFLYLLQTDPFYLKTLFRVNFSMAMKYTPKLFFTFNNLMENRENMLFIKLVSELLASDIDGKPDIENFLDSCEETTAWRQLMHRYLTTQKREHMITLFEPVLKYVLSEEIDFESVPANIYKKLHPLAPVLQSNLAIDDPDTNTRFIGNMTALWSAVEKVSIALTENIEEIPVEIRYLCTKAYQCVADRSPDESCALRAISKILISSFVNDFLCWFEDYGTHIPATNKQSALEKLSVLSHALETVFSLREFDGYFSPLNEYVREIYADVSNTLRNVLISPEFESYFEKLIYYDMGSGNKPTLTINTQYLDTISKIFYKKLEFFPHDDIIQELLKELIPISDASAISKNKGGILTLYLNPSAYKLSSVDDRIMSLYNQVKRGLIYMMQIEEVDTNLIDLLTSTVLDEDEAVFQEMLHNSPVISRDPLFRNLKQCDYFHLKEFILERSVELENMGSIDTSSKFQGVLNDIANTIKSQDYVKRKNMSELKLAQETLEKISAKHTTLKRKSKDLELAIDEALRHAQSNNDFSPAKKHGIGNRLKHMYKKVQNKGHSKPSCANYKWNTRQLYERGVLVDIEGENLGQVPVNYFGSSGPKFPNILFRISTPNGDEFGIELIDERKGAHSKITGSTIDKFYFKKLLDDQVDDQSTKLKLFRNRVVFNTSALLDLVTETFFQKP